MGFFFCLFVSQKLKYKLKNVSGTSVPKMRSSCELQNQYNEKGFYSKKNSDSLKDKINFQARLLQRLHKSYIPLPSASGLQGDIDSEQLFVPPPNSG